MGSFQVAATRAIPGPKKTFELEAGEFIYDVDRSPGHVGSVVRAGFGGCGEKWLWFCPLAAFIMHRCHEPQEPFQPRE